VLNVVGVLEIASASRVRVPSGRLAWQTRPPALD
jgi:hypothetical protein